MTTKKETISSSSSSSGVVTDIDVVKEKMMNPTAASPLETSDDTVDTTFATDTNNHQNGLLGNGGSSIGSEDNSFRSSTSINDGLSGSPEDLPSGISDIPEPYSSPVRNFPEAKIDVENGEKELSEKEKASENTETSDKSAENQVQEHRENRRLSKRDKRVLIMLVIFIWALIIAAIAISLPLMLTDSGEEGQAAELPDPNRFVKFGYTHTRDLSTGWLFDSNKNSSNSTFSYYTSEDLVPNGDREATELHCARKCSREKAFAGAWNTVFKECWCYHRPADSQYCLEPCVAEQGVEFSSRNYRKYDFCEKSYCEIFDDADEYCSFKKYDPELCFGL